MGLVVSREEFEHNLAKAAQLGLAAHLDGEEIAQLESSGTAIQARLARTQADFPLLWLIQRCGLDEFEQSCVVLAYAGVLDQKYEKLFAYLQDDITRKALPRLWRRSCFCPGSTMEEYLSRFARRDAFTAAFAEAHNGLLCREILAMT